MASAPAGSPSERRPGAARCRSARSWSTPLDPLLREPPWQNNRGIIDACRPYGWKDEFPKVAEASPDLKKQIREKYPQLF